MNWRAHSLIYQRFSGIVLGYLETGDFYLLDTAQAVARNYISHHLQNWPRQGIGRDADPLNGFLINDLLEGVDARELGDLKDKIVRGEESFNRSF